MEGFFPADTFKTKEYRFSNSQGPRNSKRVIFVVLFLIIVAGLIFGASRFLGSSNTEEVLETTPTPTDFIFPTDTPTPQDPTPSGTAKTTVTPTSVATTATPTKASGSTTTDNSDITVSIQNGSGVSGEASKVAGILRDLGYSIGSTGNADSFDYETTSIFVKPGQTALLNQLKKDLGSSYTIGSSSATLSTSNSADALVIVGKE